MTLQRTLICSLTDIRSISLVCRKCGSRLDLPPEKASNPPFRCDGCTENWRLNGQDWDKSPYVRFVEATSELRKGSPYGFEVSLEFEADVPKGKD